MSALPPLNTWVTHAARLNRLSDDAARLADDADAALAATCCQCGTTCPRCFGLVGLVEDAQEAAELLLAAKEKLAKARALLAQVKENADAEARIANRLADGECHE